MKNCWKLISILVALSVAIQAQEKKPEELITNTYTVPPTFGNPKPGQSKDPFADSSPLVKRTKAKDVLEEAGVYFPEGGTAIYNPKVSQLIVRTIKEQMEFVEAYLDSVQVGVEKQIHLKVFFIEVDEPLWEGLEQPHVEGEKISEFSSFLAEGEFSASKMMELLSASDLEAAVKEESAARVLRVAETSTAQPAGLFSDPQLEVFLESKEKARGFEKIIAPSGSSRSGQRAFVQAGDRALVISPLIGGDDFTIHLNIASRQQAKLKSKERRVERYQVSLWDTQTVALVEKTEDEKFIYTFIRAELLDPAGMPINNRDEE